MNGFLIKSPTTAEFMDIRTLSQRRSRVTHRRMAYSWRRKSGLQSGLRLSATPDVTWALPQQVGSTRRRGHYRHPHSSPWPGAGGDPTLFLSR